MARLVNFSQARDLDRICQEKYAIPGEILMENAGIRLWDYLANKIPLSAGIVFAAGRGNNGGDALVMARQAWVSGRRNIQIFLPAQPSTTSAQRNLAACLALRIPVIHQLEGLAQDGSSSPPILVDGLFGVGLERAVEDRGKEKGDWEGIIRSLQDRFRAPEAEIWALDCPSGLYPSLSKGDPVLKADHTLSVQWEKLEFYDALGREYCGEIHRVPIGFPQELAQEEFLHYEIYPQSPQDPKGAVEAWSGDTYKNRRGHLIVVGGTAKTLGAPFLSAQGAGAVGAGLVTVCLPREAAPRFADQPPNVMLEYHDQVHQQDPQKYQAMVLGPGGLPEAPEFWQWFAKWSQGPVTLVIDAQGLRELGPVLDHFAGNPARVLLTPHPGELADLSLRSKAEVRSRGIALARELARDTGCLVLYKSADPALCHPEGRVAVIPGQNPLMGTAGNGDYLAGILGALGMQFNELWPGALWGTWVHQEAGRRIHRVFVPQDLSPVVGKIIAEEFHGQ
jgi:hydroxyethylthiazole kinase-like uncharacterized protein yjeF